MTGFSRLLLGLRLEEIRAPDNRADENESRGHLGIARPVIFD
jgi:hypothetical protein